MTLSLEGERLDKLREVVFLRPGLRALKVEPVSAGSARVTVAIAPGCPLGEHPFLVRGDNGLTAWRTFWVGPYPERAEKEPNDRSVKAQAVPLGTTIEGTITEADKDCFAVELAAGERLSAEVVGLRLGRKFIDPHLTLLDGSGKTVREVDDTGISRQDAGFSFKAPHAGRYVVVVRDAAYGGDADARYRLMIGTHARPVAAYPPGGRPGEQLDLTLLGDALGPQTVKVKLPSAEELAGATFWPFHAGPASPTPLPLRVRSERSVPEREPNDDASSLGEAISTPPVALNGVLQAPGDVDLWKVHFPAGVPFDVETFAARIGIATDPVLTLRDAEGRVVAENDDGAEGDSKFRFVAPVEGDYRLEIRDQLRRGHEAAAYRLEITPVERRLSLAVPVENAVTQEGQTLLVARGNRGVVLVAVRRDAFEGPVALEWDKLPPGLSPKLSGPIEPGQYLVPLVLEADAKAPLGAELVSLVGRCREPKGGGAEVVGSLAQKVGLAFGPPNNAVYHGVTVDRFPVAVVEELPFRLEVTSPKAPVVQDGRIDLKVRVARAPGFTEAISLTLPFQPPWIEEPEPAEVADGETEAVFPLLAGKAAEARTWWVVVAGLTRVNGGKVRVCSAPIELRVVPPSCDVTIEPARTRPGVNVQVACRLAVKTPFSGKARLRLLGLPKHAKTAAMEVDANTTRVVFPIEVGADTPPAVHNTLYAELTTYEEGEPVISYLGRGGVLEVTSDTAPRSGASRLEDLRKARRQRSGNE